MRKSQNSEKGGHTNYKWLRDNEGGRGQMEGVWGREEQKSSLTVPFFCLFECQVQGLEVGLW